MKRGSAALEELLVTEGAMKNFEIDFNKRVSQVTDGECMIVVSGNLQAGKFKFTGWFTGVVVLGNLQAESFDFTGDIRYNNRWLKCQIIYRLNDLNLQTFYIFNLRVIVVRVIYRLHNLVHYNISFRSKTTCVMLQKKCIMHLSTSPVIFVNKAWATACTSWYQN